DAQGASISPDKSASVSLSTRPVISPRAGLLATMNIHDETHEIARSDGVRDIADYTRLRPSDDIVFRLSHRACDEAKVRFYLADPPGRADPAPERSVDQHHVSLQGGTQRHHLRKISAQPDHRDRRIAFKELGENFAAETHFGDNYDAQFEHPRVLRNAAHLSPSHSTVSTTSLPFATAVVELATSVFEPAQKPRQRREIGPPQ